MIVLIPAYEPDERLCELVEALDAAGMRMVVVDDGSGTTHRPYFDRAAARGAEVLHLSHNTGKAGALRLGMRHIIERWPGEDIVTADSDGQHRPGDIGLVARLTVAGDALVLGGRRFDGEVPWRSRFGNAVSRWLYKAVGGVAVHDTQTGLRGIPAERVNEMLAVPGERFAWEMNVLIAFARHQVPITEIPIETVYLDGNASSHFRPVRDSIAVLRPLLRYLLIAVGSFVLDLVALHVLFAVSGELLASVVGARAISAIVNFTLNRSLVFGAVGRGGLPRQIGRYLLSAAAMLGAGALLLALLTSWGIPLLVGKVVADATVFVGGFLLQRGFVFARTATGHRPADSYRSSSASTTRS